MRAWYGWFLVLGIWGSATPVFAQADRFELGQRLRDFEKAWDVCNDAAGKKRAAAPLTQVMSAFFSFRFGEAARLLDEARHLLTSDKPAPFEVRWAESFWVQPTTRLLDARTTELAISVKGFYDVKGDMPGKATLRVRIGEAKPAEFRIEKLPAKFTLLLSDIPGPKSADLSLNSEIIIDGKALAPKSIMVSRVEDLSHRLEAIDPKQPKVAASKTIEALTVASNYRLLKELADKGVKETNIPCARLLAESEAILKALDDKRPYYTHARSGEFWLTVPLARENAAIRIYVPEKLSKEKSVPLLVALHGAGGSENLFFEGYGDGITRKMCQERGWIMVGTRAGGALGFGIGGAPPVPALIDELAKVYPIDRKRVYLVGHSMGAAHTASLANANPELYAGVALLGGGGAMRNADKLKTLPIFIGCGSRDFALRGAKTLEASLTKAEVKGMRFKEYPDIEHITIVREAMPDVFAFFEKK